MNLLYATEACELTRKIVLSREMEMVVSAISEAIDRGEFFAIFGRLSQPTLSRLEDAEYWLQDDGIAIKVRWDVLLDLD